MLFHASEENSEPTWPTQTAINIPSAPPAAETAPTNGRSDVIGETPRRRPEIREISMQRVGVASDKMPSAINAMSDNVFAEVKTFWISLPSSNPRVFTNVSRTMIKIATSCWVERLTAYRCESVIGATIHCVGETHVSKHAEKSCERHCDCGNCSGLYHEEQRPAIEKSPQRTVTPRAGKHIGRRPAASLQRVRRS